MEEAESKPALWPLFEKGTKPIFTLLTSSKPDYLPKGPSGNSITLGLGVQHLKTSLAAQTVKHLSTMWETRVWSLGWEDPLEKEMAINSSTIAWKIPWTEKPGRLQSMRVSKSRTRLSNFTLNLQFSHSVMSDSVTPWITAHQAYLSITNARSSLRLTSIESVMPSSHLILCSPLLLLPPIPPSISLFHWVNSSHEVAKVLELQL